MLFLSCLIQISKEINNSPQKIIFLTGIFDQFDMHNLSNDFDYSYRDFMTFLQDNNINPKDYSLDESPTDKGIELRIDRWVHRIAHSEQTLTIIVDNFKPQEMGNYLIRSLFFQELLHLAKNDHKLQIKIAFVVNTKKLALEKQIMKKIIPFCKVISC